MIVNVVAWQPAPGDVGVVIPMTLARRSARLRKGFRLYRSRSCHGALPDRLIICSQTTG